MLTSASKESEKKRILQQLHTLADRSVDPSDKEIKLIYVTVRMSCLVLYFYYDSSFLWQPERMSKDKSFRSLLQKLDNAGKLCVSNTCNMNVDVLKFICSKDCHR